MSIEVAGLAGLIFVMLLIFVFVWFRPRRMARVPPKPPPEVVPERVPEPLEQPPIRHTRLVLRDVERPSAVIEPIESLPESRLRPLPVGRQQLGQLQAMFRHAPALAENAASASSKTYVLRFPPGVAQGIRTNSLRVMQSAEGGLRGIAVDAQGRIVSHATLVPASSVRVAAVAAGVFQVLAIATAQYYLPQINRRLARVEQGIRDLRERLTSQDRAILVDSLRQLRTAKRLLEAGDFEEIDALAGLVNLDAIDRDSGRVLEAHREHMERYGKEFDELALSGFFAPDFEAASEKATRYEEAALVCLQAMYVRSVAAQLLAVTGGRAQIIRAHHNFGELESSLRSWHSDRAAFYERFEERIREDATATLDLDDLKKFLGDEDTLAKKREKIASGARERRESLIASYRELRREVSKAAARTDKELHAPPEPLTLVVEMNERDEIERVYEQIA